MKVTFRKFDNGEVIAIFPDSGPDCNPGHLMSYLHVGQHGETCPEAMNALAPATPAEYHDLYRELETIYGELEIREGKFAFVVTHRSISGLRVLSSPNQNRYFPATFAAAQAQAEAMNADKRSIPGTVNHTYRAMIVEAYESGDAKGTVFGVDDFPDGYGDGVGLLDIHKRLERFELERKIATGDDISARDLELLNEV